MFRQEPSGVQHPWPRSSTMPFGLGQQTDLVLASDRALRAEAADRRAVRGQRLGALATDLTEAEHSEGPLAMERKAVLLPGASRS